MSTHPFGVEASPGKLYVSGEVDMAVAAVLLDAILSAGLANPDPELVLDLHGVTFLDSTGISALLEAQKTLRRGGVELRVTNPSEFVAKTLDMTGLTDHLGLPPVTTTT